MIRWTGCGKAVLSRVLRVAHRFVTQKTICQLAVEAWTEWQAGELGQKKSPFNKQAM